MVARKPWITTAIMEMIPERSKWKTRIQRKAKEHIGAYITN